MSKFIVGRGDTQAAIDCESFDIAITSLVFDLGERISEARAEHSDSVEAELTAALLEVAMYADHGGLPFLVYADGIDFSITKVEDA